MLSFEYFANYYIAFNFTLQVNVDMTPGTHSTLSSMLQMKLEKHLEGLTDISNQARKEYALEKVAYLHYAFALLFKKIQYLAP